MHAGLPAAKRAVIKSLPEPPAAAASSAQTDTRPEVIAAAAATAAVTAAATTAAVPSAAAVTPADTRKRTRNTNQPFQSYEDYQSAAQTVLSTTFPLTYVPPSPQPARPQQASPSEAAQQGITATTLRRSSRQSAVTQPQSPVVSGPRSSILGTVSHPLQLHQSQSAPQPQPLAQPQPRPQPPPSPVPAPPEPVTAQPPPQKQQPVQLHQATPRPPELTSHEPARPSPRRTPRVSGVQLPPPQSPPAPLQEQQEQLQQQLAAHAEAATLATSAGSQRPVSPPLIHSSTSLDPDGPVLQKLTQLAEQNQVLLVVGREAIESLRRSLPPPPTRRSTRGDQPTHAPDALQSVENFWTQIAERQEQIVTILRRYNLDGATML